MFEDRASAVQTAEGCLFNHFDVTTKKTLEGCKHNWEDSLRHLIQYVYIITNGQCHRTGANDHQLEYLYVFAYALISVTYFFILYHTSALVMFEKTLLYPEKDRFTFETDSLKFFSCVTTWSCSFSLSQLGSSSTLW